MSDFLTRLIERSVGKAAVVQPLTPGIFGRGSLGVEYSFPTEDPKKISEGQNDYAKLTQQKDTSSSMIDKSRYNSEPLPTELSDVRQREDDPSHGIEPFTTDKANHLSKQSERSTMEYDMHSTEPPMSHRCTNETEIQRDKEVPALNETRNVQPIRDIQGFSGETHLPLRDTEKHENVIPTQAGIQNAAGGLDSHSPLKAGRHKFHGNDGKTVPRGTISFDVKSTSILPENYSDRIGLSSSAPTIRVTIGRIDVRAVMQQTAPSKRIEAPKPKLSLEEYLKKRNGGY